MDLVVMLWIAAVFHIIILPDTVQCQTRKKAMRKYPTKGTGGYRQGHRRKDPHRHQTIDSLKSQRIRELLVDYQKEDPPMADRPTEVQLGIYVVSISSVSEQTMDYAISMYLRQAWRDPRLSFNPIRGSKTIRMHDKSWNNIWIPDTYFRNEKRATFHRVTVDNRMLRLNCTGFLWYVTRITAVFSCPMKLRDFPMDTQTCPMQFESFKYTMDTLYYGWIPSPIEYYGNIQMPEFKLIGDVRRDCSMNYTSGEYPCAEILFTLRRDVGYYIIQIFLPSALVVMTSWVSFWIDISGVPARVSLGITTVLTMTTMSASINEQLPKVSYIKAIDIWMIVCLVFVFMAMLEYALVNVTERNGVYIRTLRVLPEPSIQHRPLPSPTRPEPSPRSPLYSPTAPTTAPTSPGAGQTPRISPFSTSSFSFTTSRPPQNEATERRSDGTRIGDCYQLFRERFIDADQYIKTVDVTASRRRAISIDKKARKIFPLAFLLFNLIYWAVYSV